MVCWFCGFAADCPISIAGLPTAYARLTLLDVQRRRLVPSGCMIGSIEERGVRSINIWSVSQMGYAGDFTTDRGLVAREYVEFVVLAAVDVSAVAVDVKPVQVLRCSRKGTPQGAKAFHGPGT